jgi:DNA replication protein DnaC
MAKTKVTKVWKSDDEAREKYIEKSVEWRLENDKTDIDRAKLSNMEIKAYIEYSVRERVNKQKKDWEEHNPYIPEMIKNQTFENWKITEENKDIYNKIILDLNKSMIFYGDAGTGKTHMVNAMCINMYRDYLAKGKLSDEIWIKKTFYEMQQEHLAGNSYEFVGRDMESTDYYKNVPLLIIEEFGRAEFSQEMYNFVFSIINHRLENELQTIILSNIDMKEYLLNEADSGLKSRLMNYFTLLNFK